MRRLASCGRVVSIRCNKMKVSVKTMGKTGHRDIAPRPEPMVWNALTPHGSTENRLENLFLSYNMRQSLAQSQPCQN